MINKRKPLPMDEHQPERHFWEEVGMLWKAFIKPTRKQTGLYYKKPSYPYLLPGYQKEYGMKNGKTKSSNKNSK